MISLHLYKAQPKVSRVLVLIHAFPLTSKMYDKVCADLSEIDPELLIYRVDLPGFKEAPILYRWSLKEAMLSLHDELAKKNITNFFLGGTSMGGYAALAYYQQFPSDVCGLILSNTKADADTTEAKQGRETFANDVLAKGYEAVYMRMLTKLTTKSTTDYHPEVIEQIKIMITSAKPAAIAAALITIAERDDSTDLLASITVPTLVITGDCDELIAPEISEKMSRSITGSVFHEILGVGHLTPMEAPEQWSKIVASFLKAS